MALKDFGEIHEFSQCLLTIQSLGNRVHLFGLLSTDEGLGEAASAQALIYPPPRDLI